MRNLKAEVSGWMGKGLFTAETALGQHNREQALEAQIWQCCRVSVTC